MRQKITVGVVLSIILVGLLWAFCPSAPTTPPEIDAPRFRLGAYYRLDYPERFSQSIRQKLEPSQHPQLGLYDSNDVGVAEAHIDWAATVGVDFFILPLPSDSLSRMRTLLFLQAANLSDIEFCFSLEPKTEEASLSAPVTELFSHPRYLKVQERPFVVLRSESTPEMNSLASKVQSEYGCFVVQELTPGQVNLPSESFSPDAWSPRGPAIADSQEQDSYLAGTRYLAEYEEYWKTLISSAQKPVLPVVLPGFNARVSDVGSPILPRALTASAPPQSFLDAFLKKLTSLKLVNEHVPIVILDSWNDWSNDTAVEPLAQAQATVQDVSGTQSFTEGVSYVGYGSAYLELLKTRFYPLSGTIKSKTGKPLAHTPIFAWSGKTVVDHDVTDSQGRFHLPLLKRPPGEYRVGPSFSDSTVAVAPLPEGDVLRLSTEIPDVLPNLGELDLQPKLTPFTWSLKETVTTPDEDFETTTALTKSVEEWVAPGDTVLQIGPPSFGDTEKLNELVGRDGNVYVFEGRVEEYARFYASLRGKSLEQVKLLPFLVGARAGLIEQGEHLSEQRPLDSFNFPRVDAIFIYSDSGTAVLQGAAKIIERDRPVIAVSFDSMNYSSSLIDTFGSFGYRARGNKFLLGRPLEIAPGSCLLDIGSGLSRRYIASGFSVDELESNGTNFSWSNDTESELMLVLSKVEEAPYRLGIRAKAFAPIAPVKVGLMLNGAEVGEITINSEWGVHELSVPEGLLTSGSYLSNRLLLRYAKIGRPSLLTEGTKDHRALSVGVDKVWLVPGDNR